MKKRMGVSVVFAVGFFTTTAATVRLVFSEKLGASSDFTYTFSAVAITALTEGLCGFLVMCIPTIPKAYVGMRIPQLLTSISSWRLREVPWRFTTSNTNASLLNSSNNKDRGRGYIEVDGNTVPLSEVHVARSLDSHEAHSNLFHAEGGAGIVRTPKFESTEGYNSNIRLDHHERQHPWKKPEV